MHGHMRSNVSLLPPQPRLDARRSKWEASRASDTRPGSFLGLVGKTAYHAGKLRVRRSTHPRASEGSAHLRALMSCRTELVARRVTSANISKAGIERT